MEAAYRSAAEKPDSPDSGVPARISLRHAASMGRDNHAADRLAPIHANANSAVITGNTNDGSGTVADGVTQVPGVP